MNKIGYFILAPDSICYQQGIHPEFLKELKTIEGKPISQEYIDRMKKLGIVWKEYST